MCAIRTGVETVSGFWGASLFNWFKIMDRIKLEANTLVEAISLAIKFAKEPNEENFNSVCLVIFSDGRFYISERCSKNTSYSGFVPMTLDRMCLVVCKDDYPAKDWPFDLVEFCSMYGIRTSNRVVNDYYGKPLKNNWR